VGKTVEYPSRYNRLVIWIGEYKGNIYMLCKCVNAHNVKLSRMILHTIQNIERYANVVPTTLRKKSKSNMMRRQIQSHAPARYAKKSKLEHVSDTICIFAESVYCNVKIVLPINLQRICPQSSVQSVWKSKMPFIIGTVQMCARNARRKICMNGEKTIHKNSKNIFKNIDQPKSTRRIGARTYGLFVETVSEWL
jgi:hypothetical protein